MTKINKLSGMFIPNSRVMPCPFKGPKMPQNLNTFSASSKTFVPTQKAILQNANHLLVWHKMFVTGTRCK